MQKMKKIIELFEWICQNVIWFVMLCCVGFVAVLNLLYHSSVAYVWTEDVSIERTGIAALLLAVLIMVIFLVAGSKIQKFDEKKLFFVFSAIYMIAGIYWIANVSTELRMDAFSAHNGSVLMRQNDYTFLYPGQDIYLNEHQLGFVTYEYLLGFISTDVRFLYAVNLLQIIGINFVTWKFTDRCFGQNHKTNLYVIFFSFLFLPQFFFLAFAYGIIPDLFFMLLAFFFLDKYFESGKWKDMLLCILFVMSAVILKGNNIIGAIAIAILCFLRILKERSWKLILLAVCVMAVSILPGKAFHAWYDNEAGGVLCGGKPKILWIAMGTEPYYNNAAGWYNGCSDWLFSEAKYDPEKATELGKAKIRDNIYIFQHNPDTTYEFFSSKLESMWCDPMYESLWSGPLPDAGARNKTKFLNELYSGRSIEPQISLAMKGFVIVLFILTALFVIDRRNRKYDCNYIFLYFVGGFLLHIVWEAKSQYVYPYVFILLPCCAWEMTSISDRIQRKVKTHDTKEKML